MAVSPSGVLSSDLKQFVGVCVSIRNNLCLGLEVEVISLIGTLPTALPSPPLSPRLPSVISFCSAGVIFSHLLPSLPPLLSAPNLPPFLFFLTLFSPPSPSFSCCLSLFISHLFSAAGCLWSLQSTQGIETSISGRRGERSRPDRQDKRERERERRWEKLSHRLRVTLITVSWQRAHTHTLTFLWLIALTAFTLGGR